MVLKTNRLPFILALAAAIFISALGYTADTAQAAATRLPYDGRQDLQLKGAKSDYQIYALDSGKNFLVVTYQTNAATNQRDVLLQKLDSGGKLLHETAYPSAGDDTVLMVHQWGDNLLLAIANVQDAKKTIRLMKTDNQGKELWSKSYPGTGINAVCDTNDNGIIIAGYKETADTGKDLYLLKIDEDGKWQAADSRDARRWESALPQGGDQEPYYITQLLDEDDFNDGYIITGYTTAKGETKKSILLTRLNAYGKVIWERTHGGDTDRIGLAVVPFYDKDKTLLSFITAASSGSANSSIKETLLLHTNINGQKARWAAAPRAIDGPPEITVNKSSLDLVSTSFYKVPDSFKSKGNQSNDFEIGFVLMQLYADANGGGQVDVTRIGGYGQELMEKTIKLPASGLTLTNPWTVDGNSNELHLLQGFNHVNDNTIKYHTLRHFPGDTEDDKATPKRDQDTTIYEYLEWTITTLEYAGYTDIGKEIKKVEDKTKTPTLKPGATIQSDGVIDWPDKSYYFGQMKVGKATGEGVLVFPDGMWYRGSWRENMFSGQGELYLPTGEHYIGSFANHAMNGYGAFIWPTGENYKGNFLNNKRHGQGRFNWNGGVFYEGGFANDKADGYGTIKWPNGEKYIGNMLEGQPAGQGEYYFPNGEWYQGNFEGLSFNGAGAYHWPSGAVFIGEFENNRFTGQGTYYWPNGVSQSGYWRNDTFLGTELPDNFDWMKN